MVKLRTPIVLALLAVILAGGITLILKQNTSSCPVEIELPTPSEEIEVYVSGEVRNPGLYTLKESTRTADAIEAAGGFTTDADESAVNLAGTLRDGDQVYACKVGESSMRININTADTWLLEALPGIGPATAGAIIEYRAENGPFATIDDLKAVKGIGDSTIEKLEGKITVR